MVQSRVNYNPSARPKGFSSTQVASYADLIQANADAQSASDRADYEAYTKFQQQRQGEKKAREQYEEARRLSELKDLSGTIKNLVMAGAQEVFVNSEIARANKDHKNWKTSPEGAQEAQQFDLQEQSLATEQQHLSDAAAVGAEEGMHQEAIEKLKNGNGFYWLRRRELFIETLAKETYTTLEQRVKFRIQEEFNSNPSVAQIHQVVEEESGVLLKPIVQLDAPALRSKYFDPDFEKAKIKVLTKYLDIHERDLNTRAENQNFQLNMVARGGNIQSYINDERSRLDGSSKTRKFKGFSGALKSLEKDAKRMIDLGIWTSPQDINAYFDVGIREPGGSIRTNKNGQVLTYLSEYGYIANTLNEYLVEKNSNDYKQQQSLADIDFAKEEQALLDEFAQTPPSQEEAFIKQRRFENKYQRKSARLDFYSSNLSTDVLAEDVSRKRLVGLERSGLLSEERIELIQNPRLKLEFQNRYASGVSNPLSSKLFKEGVAGLRTDMRSLQKVQPGAALQTPARMALQRLTQEATDIYVRLREAGVSDVEAYRTAFGDKSDELKKGFTEPTSPYYKGTVANPFPNVLGTSAQQQARAGAAQKVLEATKPLEEAMMSHTLAEILSPTYSERVFGSEQLLLDAAEQFAKTGRITLPQLKYAEHKSGGRLSRVEVLQRALKQYGHTLDLSESLGVTPQQISALNDPTLTRKQLARNMNTSYSTNERFKNSLNQFGIPHNDALPATMLMFKGEASAANFDSINKGVAGDTPNGLPGLSQMPLKEVMRRFNLPSSHPDYIFAAGGLQITKPAFEDAMRHLAIDTSLPFSPQIQQHIVVWGLLANPNKRPRLASFLMGQSNDVIAAQNDWASEYASIAQSNGRGRYDNDKAGNYAHIKDQQQIRQALYRLREYVMNTLRNSII